jgi:hypothetical protein
MNRWVFIVIVILVLLAVVFVFTMRKPPSSLAVQEHEEPEEKVDWDWVEENCDCVERNRLYCKFEGYELGEGNFCWKESNFTNPVQGCSKYNCTGEIHERDE